MAKKTILQLTDDPDGTKADKTVSFFIDHMNYEIEVSQRNVVALEKTFSEAATWAVHDSSGRS